MKRSQQKISNALAIRMNMRKDCFQELQVEIYRPTNPRSGTRGKVQQNFKARETGGRA